MNTLTRLSDLAAQWGGDPVYDKPPRERGDGYLFYNFREEHGDREFLSRFLPAIDRTIAGVKADPGSDPDSLAELAELRAYVQSQLAVDDFTRGYIACALFTFDTDLSDKYGPADLALTALERIVADCIRFQQEQAALLSSYYARIRRVDNDPPEAYAGHDFWLTRNGHGAGFWDRGLGELDDKLTIAATAFGECDPYVGDDGKLYLS